MNYKALGNIALYFTPVAPAFHFGVEAYKDALHSVAPLVSAEWVAALLAVCAGIASAVALEAVGIVTGHLSIDLSQRAHKWARGAWLLLFAYVGCGIYLLRSVDASMMSQGMFVIAFLAYVAIGLQQVTESDRVVNTASTVRKVYAGRIKALIARCRELLATVATLTAENEALTTENAKLTKDNESLSDDVDELLEQIQTLTSENNKLTKFVDKYQSAPPVLLGVAADYAKHGKLNGTADKYGISDTDAKRFDAIVRRNA